MGPIVLVNPDQFLKSLSLEEEPLVVGVVEKQGIIRRGEIYVYVTSVKGLFFITKSSGEIDCKRAAKIRGEKLILPSALASKLKEIKE